MRLLAARAVELYAGDVDRAQRAVPVAACAPLLDLSRMMAGAMQQLRRDGTEDEFALLLARNDLRRLLEEFRRALAAEIAARRPFDGSAPEEWTDFPSMPTSDASRRPSSRNSAGWSARWPVAPAAVGRRRKPRPTGRLDVRRTVRRSIQSGGVPLDVVNRRRHPYRPEVTLLCDVSGSVADFAQATFDLVNAVHAELANVRSFAFVDGVAEVTDLFAGAQYECRWPEWSSAAAWSAWTGTATMARFSGSSSGATSGTPSATGRR